MEPQDYPKTIDKNLEAATRLLSRLIDFPSTRGQEKDISLFLKTNIAAFADETELVPIPDSLMGDPDYSFRLDNFTYRGAANLRCRLKGTGVGKSIALNTHLDVVPPTPGQKSPFSATMKNGRIFGRGACDAKGQIATLWLVLKCLGDLSLKPGGNITIDFVIEEECGGNGTLKVVRDGLAADGAVILEPTDLQIAHLVRGAVWFEVLTKGKAGHSGSPGSTVSALTEAVKVMEAIEKVREELLLVSRKAISKIASHPNPMPCTFGMLHSGNWPAAAPSESILKGVFGFLPPFQREDIQGRLIQAVSPFRSEIRFNMLNSNPSFIPEDHPLVQSLSEAARQAGIPSKPEFMNASCDSWRYTEQLGIPAVVFGGGSITVAHSDKEHISLEAIRKAAEILILFIQNWSGLNHV
jgi:acetylornithine deacetylase